MKKPIFFITGIALLVISLLYSSCKSDDDIVQQTWEQEIAQLRTAMSKYSDIEVAEGEGFIDVSGFVPNMGHHYLQPSRVDDTFILEAPEILLYAPDPNGVFQFVAVEYIVPIADIENPGFPPEGFTGDVDAWEINHDRMQWQLHVWIEEENPAGMFAPFNPVIGNGD